MASIPLVLFNLLVALTKLQSLRVLGRLGGRVMAYYLATTTVYSFVMRLPPGREGLRSPRRCENLSEMPGVPDIMLDLFPEKVVRAFAEDHVVQIAVFAILLGISTLLLT